MLCLEGVSDSDKEMDNQTFPHRAIRKSGGERRP